MRRRDFLAGLGAATCPLMARAQPRIPPAIGFLDSSAPTEPRRRLDVDPFLRGLAETGFVEGQNVTIEYRWSSDQPTLLPDLAAELVRRRVAVIVTQSTSPAALAAKAATQTIPVVFRIGADPVGAGLVTNLARPDANVTGFTSLTNQLTAKRLELLRELLPATKSIALLFNPTNAFNEAREMLIATARLGLRPIFLTVAHPGEFEGAFAALVKEGGDALVVGLDPLFNTNRGQIVSLAARYKLPAIYISRDAVLDGGLISYGIFIPEVVRAVGIYTGRILKGEKPADLPVQLSDKVELVVNLRTAKALGRTIPETILATANEVIE
jgi:putative tryptophan/tyrosine transport system substrate-binding protein